MIEFTSIEEHELIGRGILYAIEGNQLPEEFYSPDQLLNKTVKINGVKGRVIAIESHRVLYGQNNRHTNLTFSLMLK